MTEELSRQTNDTANEVQVSCLDSEPHANAALFLQQEALSSISSAGQWAYTEYSSFSGPPKGE